MGEVGSSTAVAALPVYPRGMSDPAGLWAKLAPETQQALLRHRRGKVPADVAAEVNRAGGLTTIWWFGDAPPTPEEWTLQPGFVAFLDEQAAE